MSSAPTSGPTPLQPSPLAAVLSYLVPGLGQIIQGRIGKGVLFMVCLLGMFFLGQAMGNWQNVYIPQERGGLPQSLFTRWHFLGQFWIGAAAWPAFGQYFGKQLPPPLTDYQKAPTEGDVNTPGTVNYFLVNSDKSPDLGWVYTVIAGMLNLLVIYDAYAGAAFRKPTLTPAPPAPNPMPPPEPAEGAAK